MKKKILIIFGTRPEAIKMAPLVRAFAGKPDIETRVCVTAQHREMLDQVLDFFDITPDYDLDIMTPGQSLYGLTAHIIQRMQEVLEDYQPGYVFVHGDTTTTMASALSAFYHQTRVCHVEAGLRTFDKWAPFPEEINRKITGVLADYHFAPTPVSRDNLLNEGVPDDRILVTGNTVIDALHISVNKLKDYENDEIKTLKENLDFSKKIILITGHRRENHGEGFIHITRALKEIARRHPDVQLVYPVHPNPKVLAPVREHLGGIDNISLIAPLSYPAFVWLMNRSYLIITDSGGIQEEAPGLGKPVLVMRETTERPEAVEAGTVILVGTNTSRIVEETGKLLHDTEAYRQMSQLHNPYGDGKASERIVEFIASLK